MFDGSFDYSVKFACVSKLLVLWRIKCWVKLVLGYILQHLVFYYLTNRISVPLYFED